jgi:UDP-N-acetylglucosamine diphosphorylase/glucosamine-1-phosphate N-acetyltransferase
VACFVPPYLAAAYAERCPWPVNRPELLAEGDLLLVDGRVRADRWDLAAVGPGEACFDDDGHCLHARVPAGPRPAAESIEAFITSLREAGTSATGQRPATWDYTWELVLENREALIADFVAAGRQGLDGRVEQPSALRGSPHDIYVAAGAELQPMVVIDATQGPVYIDVGAQIQSFTRIEGPCYVGPESVLLRAHCRGGTSIGRVCRVGGEVEQSILQGYVNKYHDGFLGHAYLGEWINLGAQTTNSDLKSDYSHVSVTLDGKHPVDTGSQKVGSLIGDHARTSIGTLLNTGAYVGAMTSVSASGRLLPKFIPSFSWFYDGMASTGFGRHRLYTAAKAAMGRRGQTWTEAQQAMWDRVHELTAGPREHIIRKNRRLIADRR